MNTQNNQNISWIIILICVLIVMISTLACAFSSFHWLDGLREPDFGPPQEMEPWNPDPNMESIPWQSEEPYQVEGCISESECFLFIE
ncbi:MAG: hypothetical protein JEZ06_01620 [Anaerolineaceae bacterium]|nr:hypothetical protein [Anaerolineaceae bacterium]